MPSKVSELQNDIGYLSAHQSLSDYYTKEEVDEISAVLDGKSSIKLSIPENDVEQDLSVLNIVKLSRTKYQELESTGDLISSNLYVVEVEHNDIIFGGNSFTC